MSSLDRQTVAATRRLCEFVADAKYDDIPEDVVDHAKLMLRDTLGVSLAATDSEPFERAWAAKSGELERPGGVARIPGTPLVGSLGDVALLDGVMAHALDFDDVHPEMGGHPSAPVLSALLPVAEHLHASGEETLRAFVLGTEAEITLANVLNPGHYERGWHPTAVLGTVGAAVAAGALYDLDTDRLRHAVGIAASQAGGVKANFGTMTKPYHVGQSARSGVEAARLAREGFTANPDALEADFGGFLDLFQGTPPYDFADHLDRLGDPWKLVTPRVGFKPYPCCGSTHGAIDAAFAVREALGGDDLDLGCVESVAIHEHPRRLGHTNRPDPQTPLDAKFSVQYCVVTALQEGDVWLHHFSPEAIENDRRRSCLERVTVRERADEFADDEWGATVSVELADGTADSGRVPAPRGSADNPMTAAELARKYDRCASGALSDAQVDESVDAFDRFEALDDVADLLDVLAE